MFRASSSAYVLVPTAGPLGCAFGIINVQDVYCNYGARFGDPRASGLALGVSQTVFFGIMEKKMETIGIIGII